MQRKCRVMWPMSRISGIVISSDGVDTTGKYLDPNGPERLYMYRCQYHIGLTANVAQMKRREPFFTFSLNVAAVPGNR